MRKAAEGEARFSGFPPAGLEFLRGLEADNSKAYFDAHRDTYETTLRDPLELLLAEAVRRHGSGKVFRPHRDVRFSKDKSPYKTTAALVAGEGAGGVYVALDPQRLHVGGGLYEPAREQLTRSRQAIAEHPSAGEELDLIVAELEAAGLTFAGPDLKTAPRGYPREHPRIERLRMTRYAALRSFPPGPDVHNPERSREAIFGIWERLGPLMAWIERFCGPSPPGRSGR